MPPDIKPSLLTLQPTVNNGPSIEMPERKFSIAEVKPGLFSEDRRKKTVTASDFRLPNGQRSFPPHYQCENPSRNVGNFNIYILNLAPFQEPLNIT